MKGLERSIIKFEAPPPFTPPRKTLQSPLQLLVQDSDLAWLIFS